jgi:hypothetical protein
MTANRTFQNIIYINLYKRSRVAQKVQRLPKLWTTEESGWSFCIDDSDDHGLLSLTPFISESWRRYVPPKRQARYDPTTKLSIPGGGRNFSSPHRTRPTEPPIQWVIGSFRGVKRPELEASRFPPYSEETYEGVDCVLIRWESTDVSEQYIASIFSNHSSDYCLIHAGFLLGLLLNPEGGSYVFLRNVH